MKMIKEMAMFILTCLFLTACGGGGGGNSEVKMTFELQKGAFTAASIKVGLPLSNNQIIHLVKNGQVATLDLSEAKEFHLEGLVIGYTASGKGRIVPIPNVSSFTVENVSCDDVVLAAIISKSGEKYFVNPDHATFSGSTKMIVRDGLMWYGTAADNPDFAAPTTMHTISVAAGKMTISFAMVDGYVVELVTSSAPASLKASDICRVFWNGDVAGWSLADSNPSSAPFAATLTLNVPLHDNGIIEIVDVHGNVFSLNTAKQTGLSLTTDGRQLMTY